MSRRVGMVPRPVSARFSTAAFIALDRIFGNSNVAFSQTGGRALQNQQGPAGAELS
jgi:hypothetical protein